MTALSDLDIIRRFKSITIVVYDNTYHDDESKAFIEYKNEEDCFKNLIRQYKHYLGIIIPERENTKVIIEEGGDEEHYIIFQTKELAKNFIKRFNQKSKNK